MVARPLREALVVFAIATAIVVALWRLADFFPLLYRHLPTAVAIVFLYLPVAVAWRRGEEISRYGFSLRPLRRNAVFALAAPAVLFPLFLVVFIGFYQTVCGAGAALSALAPPGMCPRFLGWEGLARFRSPPQLAEAAFTQIVVVAIPEELFFRGYLLARLEEALPPTRRLLGGGLGLALVLSAFLFALGHVLVDLDPRRFVVFFPGLLFGWLRSATGSIAAGSFVHAASNLYIDTLQRTFFR